MESVALLRQYISYSRIMCGSVPPSSLCISAVILTREVIEIYGRGCVGE